jgi:lipopolysaccharide biosynthesis protein
LAAPRARLIAFFLPQYHPIPENDEWWGRGFTEWTHVARALPLFPGHEQPLHPADLGYYDLRVPETRQAQADLARDHGIEGFCWWHYWFRGRRLLERPFAEVLASGTPDFPFCLGWANQSWTGVWHGCPERVLVRQEYGGREDDEAHFESLRPAFLDRRHLRVDGRPIFLVFQPHELPDARGFASTWTEFARRAGLPGLYLVGMGGKAFEPRLHGFDAVVRHQPPGFTERLGDAHVARVRRGLRRRGWRPWARRAPLPAVYLYEDVVRAAAETPLAPDEHPCAMPNWDNTPRSAERGVVFLGATPALFERHLEDAVDRVAARPPERRLVFVKSWNEWAEGNHLEPDHRFGRGWLEAARRVVLGGRRPQEEADE